MKKLLQWSLSNFNKKKALLAFEFGVVLSDVAKDLKVEMTKEIVLRAEELLIKELGNNSPEHFACNMNVYSLAILEPKD